MIYTANDNIHWSYAQLVWFEGDHDNDTVYIQGKYDETNKRVARDEKKKKKNQQINNFIFINEVKGANLNKKKFVDKQWEQIALKTKYCLY